MSDSRLVKGVRPINNALRKLTKLEPVEYKMKAKGDDGQKFRTGFIAQDLMKHFPDLVHKSDPDDDGEQPLPGQGRGAKGAGLSIARADAIIPYLVAAIIELEARLVALEPPQPPKQ